MAAFMFFFLSGSRSPTSWLGVHRQNRLESYACKPGRWGLTCADTPWWELSGRLEWGTERAGVVGGGPSSIVEHHYLHDATLVGEQLRYAFVDKGRRLALATWSSAAFHLKDRDELIGWTAEQRTRRRALLANNSRLLVIPPGHYPNLISRFMKLMLGRLSEDWQQRWGHPIVLVESFVDPNLYQGTAYKVSGWSHLGKSAGWGRDADDFYDKHGVSKQINDDQVEDALLGWQDQILGPRQDRIVIIDGKKVRHAGLEIINAVDSAGRFLGSVVTPAKTNEIPAARQLLGRQQLAGKIVIADAMHTQFETAQNILFEGGGDYLLAGQRDG
jgi:hypothetical protein